MMKLTSVRLATLLVSLSLSAILAVGCAAGSSGSTAEEGTSSPSSSTTTSSSSSQGGAGEGGMMQGSGGSETGSGGSAMGGSMGMGGSGGSGGADPCAMGCPAGTWDIDGNPLTGQCGCEYMCNKKSMDDPIDPNFEDDNCDGSDGVVEQCVYVSATLGSPTGAGTRQDPVDTIANGITTAAQKSAKGVCVSGEAYNETVTMVSGISVWGGFDEKDANFAFKRSPNAVSTVTATGVVFDAPQIDVVTHIEGLTIHATTPMTAGASTYGVRLGSGIGKLFVRYNVITADKGADGAAGDSGMAHANAKAPNGNGGGNGCAGTNCGFGGAQPNCTQFGGKGGDGGYNNNKGQDGSVGSGNTTPGSAGNGVACFGGGNNGGSGAGGGTKGSMGTPGAGGSNVGTIAMGFYAPADGETGKVGVDGGGAAGGGGGGGGGDTFGGCLGFPCCDADKGGGGGSGGCGGLGGNAGVGGGGGGGSFGVFAAGGTVEVTGNEITTGGGGDGGKGGDGAAGQLGGDGGTGGNDNDDSGAGGKGGKGADGGAGGPGGGGGGGPSACLAYGSGVTFVYEKNVLCQLGTAGMGGSGATNPDSGTSAPGSTGTTGATLQLN